MHIVIERKSLGSVGVSEMCICVVGHGTRLLTFSLGSSHLSLSFLLCLNFGLDSLPINLDLLVELQEAFVSLFLVVLL